MKKKNELTPQLQQQISEVILKYYTPGTVNEHDELIDITDFVDLFAKVDRPDLKYIDQVMEILGFKEEDARMDLGFFVNIVPKKEPV